MLNEYERSVINKFPCMAGYRELVVGESLKKGDWIYDRTNGAKVRFIEWTTNGRLHVMSVWGVQSINHHVWFLVKE